MSRSVRPRGQSQNQSSQGSPSGQRLEEVIRALGKPDAELLPALVEGLDEGDLLTKLRGAGCSVPQLLEHGGAILLDSHAYWQRCSAEQRAKLRGLSLPLLALTGDQLKRVQQHHDQHLRRIAEQEQAHDNHAKLMAESRLVCSQAVQVLRKVTGEDPVLDKVTGTLAHAASSAELAYRLKSLAELGARVMAQAPASVRARASLFGLGKPYLDVLLAKARALNELETRANERPSKAPERAPSERTQALLLWICGHITEVFAMAHELDEAIPLMRSIGNHEAPLKTERTLAIQMPRTVGRTVEPLTLPRVVRKPS